MYELVQNADDVHAKNAAFVVTTDGMAFLHDGDWFSIANFRSLADGWSDKDPAQCVGHKGLGFRSVLDITPAPHVLKVDRGEFFGFKFTWALNNGHIQQIFQKDPKLKQDYQEWTKHGQSACPIMAIPGEVNKYGLGSGNAIYERALKGVYAAEYTTMFWFPARDPDANQKVLSDFDVTPLISDKAGVGALQTFVCNDVVVFLPFLASLEKVRLFTDATLRADALLDGERKIQKGASIKVSWSSGNDKGHVEFFEMRFEEAIPPQIRNDSETPTAVRQMKTASLSLSVRLKDERPVHDPDCLFHVYFPTQEQTGVGAVVHGDFFVKPDRTSLMVGKYNEWLLNIAGRKFAGPFLTELLARFAAKDVFEALRPTGRGGATAAKRLIANISNGLCERRQPFVPTQRGQFDAREVALPATVDAAGFWQTHFSDVLNDVADNKQAFVESSVDSQQARKFLELAAVEVLSPTALLTLMEAEAKRERKQASWWHECYRYLAAQDETMRWNESAFVGRRILPDTNLAPIPVSNESGPAICLPPGDDDSNLSVPSCFEGVFILLNREVSELLHRGPDTLRHWLLHRCKLSRFEASELIPKAVRASVLRLFDGTISLSVAQLCELWTFVEQIIRSSRSILSAIFWQEVGRLPVPLELDAGHEGAIPPAHLCPAFLTYFPDSFCNNPNPFTSVPDLRRIAEPFFDELLRRQTGKYHGCLYQPGTFPVGRPSRFSESEFLWRTQSHEECRRLQV
jgi:hypothetical protein